MAEHLEGHLKKIGGIEKVELYTEEELDEMFEEDRRMILQGLAEMQRQNQKKKAKGNGRQNRCYL